MNNNKMNAKISYVMNVILLLWVCKSVHVEIEDVQKDYRLIFEGQASIDDDELVIGPMQLLQNNLTPQENISGLLRFSGYTAKVTLDELEQTYLMSQNFQTKNEFRWISRPAIRVKIMFSGRLSQQDKELSLYTAIRIETKKPFEDF